MTNRTGGNYAHIITCFPLIFFLFCGVQTVHAGFSLSGDDLRYEQGGKKTVFKAKEVAISQVPGSDLVYVVLEEK